MSGAFRSASSRRWGESAGKRTARRWGVPPFAFLRIVIGNADRIEFGGGVNFKL
jgi:hypothetical protein